ncbi:MAG: glycosyltransferase family 39 protein [Chloroflexi bacterium]|nr:glycosyltransferase family 39 protein [Chloroflexota bacterium]
MSRGRHTAIALFLVAGAVAARVAFPGDRQLFRDEAASWLLARYPIEDLVRHAAVEPYPPLYQIVLKGWMAIAGDSEAALRALSAAWGLGLVLAGWRWATESLGRSTGLGVLAILAASPLALANARDARMYAMDAAAATIAWWMLWRLASGRSSGRLRNLEAAVLFVAVAIEVWTFTYGLVVAGLQFLVAVAPLLRGRRPSLRPVVAIAAGGATILPWVPNLLGVARDGPFWTPRPAIPDVLRPIMSVVVDPAALPFSETLAGLAIAAVAGYGLLALTRAPGTVPANAAGADAGRALVPVLGAGVALVPVIWLVSQVHPIFDPRYFGAAIVPVAILVAAGLRRAAGALSDGGRAATVAHRGVTLAAAAILAVGAATWVTTWRSGLNVAPAREVVAELQARMRPGDIAVAADARSYFPVAYLVGRTAAPTELPGPLYSWDSGADPYYRGQGLLEAGVRLTPDEATWGDLAGLGGAACGRVWLITLADGIGGAAAFAPLRDGDLVERGRIVLPTTVAGKLLDLEPASSVSCPSQAAGPVPFPVVPFETSQLIAG